MLDYHTLAVKNAKHTNASEGTAAGLPAVSLKILNAALESLRSHGLRVTRARTALIELLIRQVRPVSTENLFADLATSPCDLVTVYRNIDAFERIGLVNASFRKNGTRLWQLAREGRPIFHIHSVDPDTVKAIDANDAADLHALVRRITERAGRQGYINLTAAIQFFGEPVKISSR